MANCARCKEKLGFLSTGNYCDKCTAENAIKETEDAQNAVELNRLKKEEQERRSKAEALERTNRINAILLTTETAPNLNITKRIEIVTAECAFGMNIFKDLFAGVRDIVGGRSKAVQQTMRDARRTALYELKAEAHLVGANAVVGVDLDYVDLGSSGSMVMLVASGTAVIIED
ncbi:YbjQ family protein [Tateyamaria pelophila]|uniref:YbjQ family protein n=1 Tax=Tateyamaria pelophila TaxID=328415 RepID=UPI001CBC968F|nr:heavy metal-binding domain-containing protein [Tateyamaria pelophila]